MQPCKASPAEPCSEALFFSRRTGSFSKAAKLSAPISRFWASFVGYQVTIVGCLIGLAYGFVTGFLTGYLAATLYNWFGIWRMSA
jgi:hypothetical protein